MFYVWFYIFKKILLCRSIVDSLFPLWKKMYLTRILAFVLLIILVFSYFEGIHCLRHLGTMFPYLSMSTNAGNDFLGFVGLSQCPMSAGAP